MFLASNLYGVNATIIMFVLFCIMGWVPVCVFVGVLVVVFEQWLLSDLFFDD